MNMRIPACKGGPPPVNIPRRPLWLIAIIGYQAAALPPLLPLYPQSRPHPLPFMNFSKKIAPA